MLQNHKLPAYVVISDDLVKLLNLISVLVTKDKLGQKYLRQVVSDLNRVDIPRIGLKC